ncbi:MAG TPA: OB-fold domain-containing protein [Ilumatobacteraceae bacterium]|nr:OB-fold domain-containing protein [Ilumatobacteraceae bacterium]
MVEQTLPATGTVWSWTVQRIAVKAPYAGPQPFEPFAVGYVDLGPLKVETPLFGHPVDGWSIGEAVELAAGDEHPYLPFWFRPTAGGHQ